MIIESIGKIVQDRPVFTIAAEATVQQACEILDRENVDALQIVIAVTYNHQGVL